MPILLVVDDSPADRALISGLLCKEGEDWLVESVENGAQALDLLEVIQPHVVITDMEMPGVGGMAIVSAVRERFSHVPVILVTGRGNEDIAVKALQQGAASYVAKTNLANQLGETVKQVLQLAESNRSYQRLIQSLKRTEHSFSLENDPSLIPPVVTLVQDMSAGMELCDETERRQLGIALDEALMNAMYHGNLELPIQKMPEVRAELREGRIHESIVARQTETPYTDRRVDLQVCLATDRIELVVSNGGNGFDVAQVHASSEAASELAGRGLRLIRTFMDQVEFSEDGRRLSLVKFVPKRLQRVSA